MATYGMERKDVIHLALIKVVASSADRGCRLNPDGLDVLKGKGEIKFHTTCDGGDGVGCAISGN